MASRSSSNGITCPPNFMGIYPSFQKLLDRQAGDLISQLLFLESRLNKTELPATRVGMQIIQHFSNTWCIEKSSRLEVRKWRRQKFQYCALFHSIKTISMY
jgi:hypothetical protein